MQTLRLAVYFKLKIGLMGNHSDLFEKMKV